MKILPLALASLFFCAASWAETIGILLDGPNDWYADVQVANFQSELTRLLEGKQDVSYKTFDGHWTDEGIQSAVREALADDEVDIIYTAGFIGSMLTQRLTEADRSKPVFAGAIRYSSRGSYPISSEGTSSLPNFTFIGSPQRVEADLEMLKRLTGANRVEVLIDGHMMNYLPDLDQASQAYEKALGLRLAFIPGTASAKELLEAIPSDAQAVYVSILGQLSGPERKALYAGLADRKLVHLAMAGDLDLEYGAMAGLAPDTRKPIARRIALGMFQLIRGGRTDDLQVYLPVEDRLQLNLSIAKTMGWSPSYDLHLESGQLCMDILQDAASLDLVNAMKQAAEQNAELAVAEQGLNIQRATERQSVSTLRPRIDVTGTYGLTDTTSPIDPTGPEETEAVKFGAQLSQILYNDSARTARKAARAQTRSSQYGVDSTRLDAMESAGIAFLNLALNRELFTIQKENLRLTENNLRLAKLRKSIGSTDATEVYRWESNAARDRANLFTQNSAVRNSLAELNRILGASQRTRWSPVPFHNETSQFYFLEKELRSVDKTDFNFDSFRDFVILKAVDDSLELKQFDAALEAQGYVLRSSKRKRFVPELTGVASWNHVTSDTNLGPGDDQQEWFIGVSVNIPLFEGGGIRAQVAEQKARIGELEAQRMQATQFIQQQTLSVWNGMRSTHPAIQLTRMAREAAAKNYIAVRDKYSQGESTLLDLLDAQSQQLQQEQEAVRALYSYLTNIIRLQRSISWFEHDQSAATRAAWASEFMLFMNAQHPSGKDPI